MSESDRSEGVIRLQDSGDVKEFEGKLLSEVSTRSPWSMRWTVMRLYKMTDGTSRYVLHVVGHSVIYHVYRGPCNSGVHAYRDELPQVIKPCRECSPPNVNDVPIANEVALEEERYTVYVCDNPTTLINKLHNPKLGGKQAGVISGPGQRLLAEASLIDDAIFEKINTVVRL